MELVLMKQRQLQFFVIAQRQQLVIIVLQTDHECEMLRT
jgi:hypothetical protein